MYRLICLYPTTQSVRYQCQRVIFNGQEGEKDALCCEIAKSREDSWIECALIMSTFETASSSSLLGPEYVQSSKNSDMW